MQTITLKAKFVTITDYSQLMFQNDEHNKKIIMEAVNAKLKVNKDEYKLPFSNDGKYFRVNLPPWERRNLRLKLKLNEDLRKKEVTITLVVNKYCIVDNNNIEHKGVSLIYSDHRVIQDIHTPEEDTEDEPEIHSD